MNIDVNKSEFFYTEDYDVWASVVDSIRPKFLKSHKLKFLTAPTSSYYDRFLIAKCRKGTLAEFKKILAERGDDVVLYYIQNFTCVDPLAYTNKIGYAFTYALISQSTGGEV